MADRQPHRFFPVEVFKEAGEERGLTPAQILGNALYDKGYRRGQTYTPRGSLQPVRAFTAYIKDTHLLVMMEYGDGGCDAPPTAV